MLVYVGVCVIILAGKLPKGILSIYINVCLYVSICMLVIVQTHVVVCEYYLPTKKVGGPN